MRKVSKLLTVILVVCLLASLAIVGISASSADESSASGSALSKFQNLDVDAKLMGRMWFPDGSAGYDDNDTIAKQINALAEQGFGGVEVAMLMDASNITNVQAKDYGWGSPGWQELLKKVFRAANAVPGGFKVEMTMSAHWPLCVNTIDPNDDAASQEITSSVTKIRSANFGTNSVQVLLPTTRYLDQGTSQKNNVTSQQALFVFNDKLISTTIAQVKSVTSDDNIVIDYSTMQGVTDITSEVTLSSTAGLDEYSYKEADGTVYSGHPAGIPDAGYLAKLQDAGVTAASGITTDRLEEWFGPDTNTGDSKVDPETFARKRNADWQYEYQVDLSSFENLSVNNSVAIAAGDWVVISTFRRGTGQILSGGGASPMYNRAYAPDYYDTLGIDVMEDYWEKYLLDDELLALIEANVEPGLFEDSLEVNKTTSFWSYNLLEKFDEEYGYTDKLAAVVAQNISNASFRNGPRYSISADDSIVSRISTDYSNMLNELYATDHVQASNDFAAKYGMKYRAQARTGKAATIVDVLETDQQGSTNIRKNAGYVNMLGSKYLSQEGMTAIYATYGFNWEDLLTFTLANYSDGINRVVLHGTPYSKQLNGNYAPWPGWEPFYTFGNFGESHTYRQIYWSDYKQMATALERVQAVMQTATAKIDIAFYNDSANHQSILGSGYSYNFVDEVLFHLDTATVTNGRLYADGVAFKVLIMKNASTLGVDTMDKLMEFAEDGLPIIFIGSTPSGVSGTEIPGVKTDALVTEKAAALLEYDNVHTMNSSASDADILAKLDEIGVEPYSSYDAASLESTMYYDSYDGTNYYYLFNDAGSHPTGISEHQGNSVFKKNDLSNVSLTLEGTGTPYILDPVTGSVTQAGEYTVNGDGTVTVKIDSIEGGQAVFVAVSDNYDEFPAPMSYVTDVDAEDGTYSIVRDEYANVALRSNTPGSYQVTLSGGQVVTAAVDGARESVSMTNSDWNLTIDSYGPKYDSITVDERGIQEQDPSEHAVTTMDFGAVSLGAWTNISATPEQLSALGVASMNQVSGIGYYSTTFEWDGGNAGAILNLTYGYDSITGISVNGVELPAFNHSTDKIDIGKHLIEGTNVLEIKATSTLRNRYRYSSGSRLSQHTYGITAATLAPYTQVSLVEPVTSLYEEYDGNIVYTGSWSNTDSMSFSQKRAKKTSRIGDSASFTFEGQAFQLISYHSASQGIIDISIDGQQMATVDLYADSYDTFFQSVVYESPVLQKGKHTVTIRVVGKNPKATANVFYLDALNVTGRLAPLETIIGDNNSRISTSLPTTVVSLPASANISVSESNPSSGTVTTRNGQIVYTATKCAATDSFTYSVDGKTATVTVLRADLMRYEESFAGFTKTGTWSSYNVASYSGGTAYRSNVKDSTISFTLEGTGFDVISYKSFTRGTFQVVVTDSSGATVVNEEVNCWDPSADTLFQYPVYQSGTLAKGTYKVTITVLQNKNVEFDGVDIYK